MRSISLSQTILALGFISHFAVNAKLWSHDEDLSQTFLKQDEEVLPLRTRGELLTSEVSNTSSLEEHTRREFLNKFASSLGVRDFFVEMWGQIWWEAWTGAPRGTWMQIDIMVPITRVCRPRISRVQELSPGIICQQSSCKFTKTMTLERRYDSTVGFSYSVTAGGGLDIKVINAGITRTFGFEYTHTWSHGSSTGASYEFDLVRGEQCIPSMVHVEMECDIEANMVYYDTFWQGTDRGTLWVANNHFRGGGPFVNGQWCHEIRLNQDILIAPGVWTPVLPGGEGRGFIYTRDPTEIVRHITPGQPSWLTITKNDVVIRKNQGSGGDFRQAFVCRKGPLVRRQNVIVPASGERSELLGFVACVNV